MQGCYLQSGPLSSHLASNLRFAYFTTEDTEDAEGKDCFVAVSVSLIFITLFGAGDHCKASDPVLQKGENQSIHQGGSDMAKAHSFTCGDIQGAVLCEGESTATIEELVGRYPGKSQADIAAALGGEVKTEDSLNVLYLESRGCRILADVGFGAAARPAMGQTELALEQIGLSASDIDIVYLTHFHGDHIAGLVDADGEPIFSQARYLTAQAEWDEWMGPDGRWRAADDVQQIKNMESLQDRLDFVSPGDEIADGVTVVGLEGHTMGHTGLLVESRGERLIHVVDLLHQAFQFEHLDWGFVFDSDTALATETRKRILHRCADEQLLTLFYHLDFPGLGYVRRDEAAFQWHPLVK